MLLFSTNFFFFSKISLGPVLTVFIIPKGAFKMSTGLHFFFFWLSLLNLLQRCYSIVTATKKPHIPNKYVTFDLLIVTKALVRFNRD